MIEKRLSVIEKEQKFNNNNLLLQQNQIMEQNIAINRLTDTLSEFFEKDFGMKWKRNTAMNTILDREDLIVDNSEATTNQRKLPDWETVAQTLRNCPIQIFIYEYMDNECEKVYDKFEGKDSKHRKQKSNFTTLYNMLITCLPDGVPCVCDRPTVTEELIQWKIECQELSKKCAVNARKIYEDAGCSGNFTKSALCNKQNNMMMNKYIQKQKDNTVQANKEDVVVEQV